MDGRVVKKRYLKYDASTLVYNATVCRVIFSTVSAVIGVIYVLAAGRGSDFSLMFSILLVNSILTNLRFGMANRFEYQLKAKKIVLAADISAFLGGLLQLAAVAMDRPIIAIAVIASITSTLNLLIVFIQYRVEFGRVRKGKLDKALVTDMIKESLPLALAASCATIYSRCDSIMLGNMLTDAEVGIYAISLKLIAVVQIAIVAIRESVYPNLISLYATDKEKYARQYVRITSCMTWLCIVGVSASFLILPYIFRFLSKDYMDAFPVYKILVIETLFMYNATLRAGHYALSGRGDILLRVQLPCVVLNVILNWFGIKAWGMYGAAAATVFTQGVSLFFSNLFVGPDGREVFMWQLRALNPVNIFR